MKSPNFHTVNFWRKTWTSSGILCNIFGPVWHILSNKKQAHWLKRKISLLEIWEFLELKKTPKISQILDFPLQFLKLQKLETQCNFFATFKALCEIVYINVLPPSYVQTQTTYHYMAKVEKTEPEFSKLSFFFVQFETWLDYESFFSKSSLLCWCVLLAINWSMGRVASLSKDEIRIHITNYIYYGSYMDTLNGSFKACPNQEFRARLMHVKMKIER